MTQSPPAQAAITSLTLAPNAQAAGRARRFIRGALEAYGDGAMWETAQLLVSELVTNAVVHAASAVEVEAVIDGTGLLARVRDADTGPLVSRAGGGSELHEGGRA